MPVRVTRRSLGLEIGLSLVVKVAALLAIGLLLFGPDDRIRADAARLDAAIMGAAR